MKLQQGFTLIELMIVVAIVAILAAVAIPFYADFTVRAKSSELAAALDACKVSMTDYKEAEGAYTNDENVAGCDDTVTQYASTAVDASDAATDQTIALTIIGNATDTKSCEFTLCTNNGGADWAGAYNGDGACERGGWVPPLFRAVTSADGGTATACLGAAPSS